MPKKKAARRRPLAARSAYFLAAEAASAAALAAASADPADAFALKKGPESRLRDRTKNMTNVFMLANYGRDIFKSIIASINLAQAK